MARVTAFQAVGRGFESRLPLHFAHVAQSAEHFLGKEEVTGSIPVVGFFYDPFGGANPPSFTSRWKGAAQGHSFGFAQGRLEQAPAIRPGGRKVIGRGAGRKSKSRNI